MIICPKKNLILENRMSTGLQGYYRVQILRPDGRVRYDTGFFRNTILNSGRNIMASYADWIGYCQVGTDNTAPNQSDTSLLGYVAGTSNVQSTITGQASSEPYFGWKRKVYRFSAGTVAANLSEVGVGWGSSGSTLISRALIIDPITQLPTAITPLADEILDVTYELRYYPPLVDATSPQVVLDGVTYNTLTRASRVTDAAWSSSIGSQIGVSGGLLASDWKAWDGVIGTILLGPSGLSAQRVAGALWNSAYISNSYEIDINITCMSTGWNLVAGIRSVDILTTAGRYQTQFNAVGTDNTIPKDITYNITLSWTLGWTEKI